MLCGLALIACWHKTKKELGEVMSKPPRKCLVCGDFFERIMRPTSPFCSKQCADVHKSITTCAVCGKDFFKQRPGQRYCSLVCEEKRRQFILLQQRCRSEFRNAVRRGELIRPSVCHRCGNSGVIEGHHEDYRFPLSVYWLCRDCHRKTLRGGTFLGVS